MIEKNMIKTQCKQNTVNERRIVKRFKIRDNLRNKIPSTNEYETEQRNSTLNKYIAIF